MERERILAVLREHEQELKAAGLLHLRLFGSVARGENGPESDVDLLFDYDESSTRNLLRAYGFQDEMSEMLGVSTHLSCAKYMRPALREQALREAVVAY
jgi:predicted nucleotidyltransferase